jgi:P pilus assembly chaperone PapD
MTTRFFVCAALTLLGAAAGFAQIGVSPSIVETTLDERGAASALRLLNLGTRTVEVKVTVQNWDLDDANNVRVLPPNEQSLDQWIVVQPLRFTVAAGKSQTVRLAIRPRTRPEPGEHRAIVFFEEVAPKDEAVPAMRVLFRLGVAVYAYAGTVTRLGALCGITVDQDAALFDVESFGSAHVRLAGQYAIWEGAHYPGAAKTQAIADIDAPKPALPAHVVAAGPLPTLPVLPGARRRIRVGLPKLGTGDYILDVKAKLGDDTLTFGVPFVAVGGERSAAAKSPGR